MSVPLAIAPALSRLIDRGITLLCEFLLLVDRGDYVLGCRELRVTQSQLAFQALSR